MSVYDDVLGDVQGIITKPWNLRKGTIVPSTDTVALAGGAVELNATFLYADLADSSKMAKELDRRVAARIMKSFLATSSRLIRAHNGVIQSFDGDRVMGVFVGDNKNTRAVKCALKINYVVDKIIRPKFENNYDSVKDASFRIRHCTGVDTGTVMAVRAGARGANDLIWIGRAPNLAAKLSDIRNGDYHTYITASVYNIMAPEAKYGGEDKRHMWESRTWTFLGQNIAIYRSDWRWRP